MKLFSFLGISSNQTFTDLRDGQKYKLAKIGNQVWMAENLRFAAPGSCCCREIDPKVNLGKAKGIVAMRSAVPGQKSQSCCREFGRLYDWQTALASIPSGWHLPTSDEWDELIQFLGGPKLAGKQMKHGGSSGFNAAMSGFAYLYLTPYPNERIVTVFNSSSLKANTTFWSSTRLPERWRKQDHPTGYIMEFYRVRTYGLGIAMAEVRRELSEDYHFHSVRCVQDKS